MAREIDESWVEEAIERYRRIEAVQAEYDKAVHGLEVTVRSPDDRVEVVVTGAGEIRTVTVVGNADLSRSIQSAVTAATDAAHWARQKLHAEAFGEYRRLGES
jgi:DNA-binding protein YbaB